MPMRVLALVLVAAIALPAAASADAHDDHDERRPQVVVAVADSGVNPYHEIYHRPENTEHPCTWVEGFDDCSIPALELSIGEYDTYADAVAADRAVWDSVVLHQWYWIPRTNIIGAVCEGSTALGTSIGVCILDDHGHGTGTTSSVLTEAPDALLLVHEGNSGAYDLATAPVVPDIQSHSWGPAVPLPLHAADPVLPGESIFCGDEAFDAETIFFIAAGNAAPFPTPADCSRVNERHQVVGGGYPGYWETSSWSVYDFASWFCRPTALHNSTTAMRASYCGTSFAAPTAAGAAAAALLEIRRREDYTGRSTTDMVSTTVSRKAFLEALRAAASYTPERKFPNNPRATSVPLPQQAPYLFWGWGWLDGTVTGAVVDCALGGPCPAKATEAREYNERRNAVRRLLLDDAVPPPPQDDAGSGRDAGTTLRTAVPVSPDVAHSGQLQAYVTGGDREDWYTFTAKAGQRINVAVAGVIGCWEIRDPEAALVGSGCVIPGPPSNGRDLPATMDGTYVLSYRYFAPPQDYRFGIGLDRPAPPL